MRTGLWKWYRICYGYGILDGVQDEEWVKDLVRVCDFGFGTGCGIEMGFQMGYRMSMWYRIWYCVGILDEVKDVE